MNFVKTSLAAVILLFVAIYIKTLSAFNRFLKRNEQNEQEEEPKTEMDLGMRGLSQQLEKDLYSGTLPASCGNFPSTNYTTLNPNSTPGIGPLILPDAKPKKKAPKKSKSKKKSKTEYEVIAKPSKPDFSQFKTKKKSKKKVK